MKEGFTANRFIAVCSKPYTIRINGKHNNRWTTSKQHLHKSYESHAPQYLNGLVAAHGSGLRGREFCHGGFSRKIFSRVFQLSRSPSQQACLVPRQHHLADLELDHLEVGDWPVKGLSLKGVLDGTIDRSGGDSKGLAGDADPAAV